MAATAGIHGARKGVLTFPRLTGKAVLPIVQYMNDGDTSPKPTFLMGMMLCQMWRDNMEMLIPENYYDMTFMSATDDPQGCVDSHMSRNGHGGLTGDMFQESLDEKLITYDVSPMDSGMEVIVKDDEGNDVSYGKMEGWGHIDDSAEILQFHLYFHEVDTSTKERHRYIKEAIYDIFTYGTDFPWNGLIWALATRENGIQEARPKGTREAKERIALVSKSMEILDQSVREMIELGYIRPERR